MSAVFQPKRKTLVPIMDWAQSLFPTKTPHRNTLRRWTHEGRISPQPEKVGKNWFVSPHAEYHGD